MRAHAENFASNLYAAAGFDPRTPPSMEALARELLGSCWARALPLKTPKASVHDLHAVPGGAMYVPMLRQIELSPSLVGCRRNWAIGREVARAMALAAGDAVAGENFQQMARALVLPLAAIDHGDFLNMRITRVAEALSLPLHVVIERLADVTERLRISAA